MTNRKNDLKLCALAIGSLPHTSVNEAMQIVAENFEIPFWPQLAKINKNEDMIYQFLEGMPGVCVDEKQGKIYMENESDIFFEQLEDLFVDYDEVVSSRCYDSLEKYSITDENSLTFNRFLLLLKERKPKYAKGQVTGPFTLSTSLTDESGKCAFYDETLREVIVKTLSLKAIWQILRIKEASPDTIPIIFIDEPSVSQLGTSAFITISKEEVVNILKEISDLIKEFGGLSAIHCCGKCDWSLPIDSKVSIINLDGYFFAQNLSLFADEIDVFLKDDGIVAWGIVPTLDSEALEGSDISTMMSKFEDAIGYLKNKGVSEELLLNQSMVTPSCGAGSLSVELAQKAMALTNELSFRLKEKHKN